MLNWIFRKLDAILDDNRSFIVFVIVMILSTFWIGIWGLFVFPILGILVGLYIFWPFKQEETESIDSIPDGRGEEHEKIDQVHLPEVPHRNHA